MIHLTRVRFRAFGADEDVNFDPGAPPPPPPPTADPAIFFQSVTLTDAASVTLFSGFAGTLVPPFTSIVDTVSAISLVSGVMVVDLLSLGGGGVFATGYAAETAPSYPLTLTAAVSFNHNAVDPTDGIIGTGTILSLLDTSGGEYNGVYARWDGTQYVWDIDYGVATSNPPIAVSTTYTVEMVFKATHLADVFIDGTQIGADVGGFAVGTDSVLAVGYGFA